MSRRGWRKITSSLEAREDWHVGTALISLQPVRSPGCIPSGKQAEVAASSRAREFGSSRSMNVCKIGLACAICASCCWSSLRSGIVEPPGHRRASQRESSMAVRAPWWSSRLGIYRSAGSQAFFSAPVSARCTLTMVLSSGQRLRAPMRKICAVQKLFEDPVETLLRPAVQRLYEWCANGSDSLILGKQPFPQPCTWMAVEIPCIEIGHGAKPAMRLRLLSVFAN